MRKRWNAGNAVLMGVVFAASFMYGAILAVVLGVLLK